MVAHPEWLEPHEPQSNVTVSPALTTASVLVGTFPPGCVPNIFQPPFVCGYDKFRDGPRR